MIASIADAIAGVVEQEDFVYGWRVSVAGEPVGPDDAITFYDTGRQPRNSNRHQPARTVNTGQGQGAQLC